jgi:prophage tail gpP-like protein
VRITRSVEALSSSFEISTTDRWSGQSTPWPILEGDACTISAHGVPVVTGYVDWREVVLAADDRLVTVGGRDRAGDLVDCSAQAPWEYRSVGLIQFAASICAPHGVVPRGQSGVVLPQPAARLVVDPGSTVADTLESALRPVGVLAMPDGLGGLVIGYPGHTRIPGSIDEGTGIVRGRARFDLSGRYRTYRAVGSRAGSDEDNGVSLRSSATSTDLEARAGRVLVVRAEGLTAAQLRARAEWEAAVRAARGDVLDLEVVSWTDAGGSLWALGGLIHVRSQALGVDADLVIADLELTRDVETGTRARLGLRRPDAYRPDPSLRAPAGGGNHYWRELLRPGVH